MPKAKSFEYRYLLVTLWVVLTTALCVWWVIFGLTQLEKLSDIQIESNGELLGHQRMLIWEGLFLLVLLIAGGATLMYFVWREKKRRQSIEEFFASFTHELKTSLASLRLQSESLQEDLEGRPESILASRLVSDTVRIEMQLENSLFLSRESQQALYIEPIDLSRLVNSLRHHWPQLKIEGECKAVIKADSRALTSVIKNLLQNASIHGKASIVKISTSRGPTEDTVQLDFSDDGSGFKGSHRKLAKLFHRHSGKSGSGIGLFICKQLVERMNGQIDFVSRSDGFQVRVILPGALL